MRHDIQQKRFSHSLISLFSHFFTAFTSIILYSNFTKVPSIVPRAALLARSKTLDPTFLDRGDFTAESSPAHPSTPACPSPHNNRSKAALNAIISLREALHNERTLHTQRPTLALQKHWLFP